MTELITASGQYLLDLKIEKEVEIDGIGMGVLSDGTPYLNARGLARMCGIDHTMILRLGETWATDKEQPRVRRIRESLIAQGIDISQPYIETSLGGSTHHAYPDTVCMAVLEYYAFDAKQSDNTTALKNYRTLARASFKQFIYTKIGYDPAGLIPESWRQFHDRVTSAYGQIPTGYFAVFKETADIIVELIRNGADVGTKFIPDISVGIAWSAEWVEKGYDAKFGSRIKYDHNYPDYFPQAESNPQQSHCYPEAALPAFRKWMREEYLPEKLPKYLAGKIRQGMLPASLSEIAMRLTGPS
ncbi:hypothetical protein L2D00_07525 [Hyphomonadaceae bacterium BL14]|nr:hypothetical protein L2D00_07525 [Hyphomonadaceae bacterium BL14]